MVSLSLSPGTVLQKGASTARLAAADSDRMAVEEALRISEERYRLIAENAKDVVWVRDLSFQMIYVSPSVERLRGYSVEEAMLQTLEESLTPASAELALCIFAESLAKIDGSEPGAYLGASQAIELEMTCKDGSTVWTETFLTLLPDERGQPAKILGITRDIRKRKRAEDALHRAYDEFEKLVEERTRELERVNRRLHVELCEREKAETALRESAVELQALFSAMDDLVIVYDRQGRYRRIAPTRTTLLYRAETEMLGRTVHEVLPARQADLILNTILLALDSQRTVTVDYNLAIGGREMWFAGGISPLSEDLAILVARDITERKQLELKLQHEAFHDALTGLPNRSLFMDRLEQAVERSKRYEDGLMAVLFLDLDQFKTVNDHFGHLSGDKLLADLAHRLQSCLRPGDTIARIGGDEFAILLENMRHLSEVLLVARRLLSVFSKPFYLAGEEIEISASIGITTLKTGNQQPEDLLQEADMAMYQAKAKGRARYEIFDPRPPG